MDKKTASPRTLLQAVRYFKDAYTCLNFMREIRWPEGVKCPHCGSSDVTFLANARLWKCKTKHPRQKFSVKVGTIFEDSPVGLEKWLPAMWLLVNCKNGVSSYEIARDLGVTQKTAWFMMHRLRLATQTGSFMKLSGEVEADETFIGGKARNMHLPKRQRRITGTGGKDKVAVMGMLERGGRVKVAVVRNRKKRVLQDEVRNHVAAGSALYTDALLSYDGLAQDFAHGVIDHAEAYVDGKIHTNGLENFWSLLKRGISGTYVSVEPFHLFRYLDEQAYRFNERKLTDAERFANALSDVVGRRVTYRELTGRDGEESTPAASGAW